MRFRYKISAATGALLLAAAGVANATPVTLQGNYVEFGVSDYGTLGSDGSTEPGILHDPTGMKNFGVNDYLTPGTPHEGFSLNSAQSGFISADNNYSGGFGTASPTLLTGAAKMGYDNAATWSGTDGTYYNVTNSYFLNDGDQRITIVTTITALQDLTDVAFARSLDPDPDVYTYGSYSTNNQQGNSLYGPTDFVGAAGPYTGLTIGLLNLSGNTYTHNTEIDYSCCSNIDPYTVLLGGNAGPVGDYGLNMAWNLGNLVAGQSVTLNYAYVVGDHIGTVGGPTGGVPEPATWALMILGMGGVGAMLRKRRHGLQTA